MKFILTIDCDNAAFGESEDEQADELVRILREAANRINNGEYGDNFSLRDVNGNNVGDAHFEAAS